MKKWLLLGLMASVLLANETFYEYGDLEEKQDGTLIEVKTKKPANGIGRFFYESGELKGETPFKNGLRDGMGKIFYKSGSLKSETPFVADKIDGLKREFFESGKIQSTVPFQNNQAEGVAKFYYPNGVLQGETLFKNNQPSGITKLYDKNGALARSIEFKDGMVIKGYDYDAKGKAKELSPDEIKLIGSAE